MMNKIRKNGFQYLAWIALGLLVTSCENYFGEETDLGFIDIPDFQDRDVAYVPIQPILNSFQRPVDIIAGFDELIYIVDEATEEIISMDEAGRVLGRFRVQGVTSVAQDRRLDLLAVGTQTDTINGVVYDLSCIYRIDLHGALGYGLQYARIDTVIVHPFYFKNSFSSNDPFVTFNKVAVVADNIFGTSNNYYYVTRSGPRDDNGTYAPDDAVLLFSAEDEFVTPINITTSGGFFRDYFKTPFGISTLAQPPQITARAGFDFLFTSTDPDGIVKVQYIEFRESEFGSEYAPRQLITDDYTQADGFLSTPNKFVSPTSVTITGDGTNYIFVADAEKDSVYQFTSTGLEGILPPPASGSNKFVKASFGGTGIGPTQFNEPRAVAYFNEILYVADAGNGRVLRFKLTLDFE